MILPYAIIGAGLAATALGGWMAMHPDNTGPNEWARGSGDSGWISEGIYGGGVQLEYSAEMREGDGLEPGSYWHEGLQLKARPYWAKRIWPRVWYALEFSFRYVRNTHTYWVSPEGVEWSMSQVPDVEASIWLVEGSRNYGPFKADHYVDQNGAEVRDPKIIKDVIEFLRDATGPIGVFVTISCPEGKIGERVVTLPQANFKKLLEHFPGALDG